MRATSVLLAALLAASVGAERNLTLPAGATNLTVAIFTDLHFGENEEGPWGPYQDGNSTEVMRTVLRAEKGEEQGLDLVVFLGDQLTGNNVRDNATAYWNKAVGPCVEVGQPWAAVFGNHDDMPFEEPTAGSAGGARDERGAVGGSAGPRGGGSTTSRAELLAFDMGFAPLSLSCSDHASSGGGVSNYVITVLAPAPMPGLRPGSSISADTDGVPVALLYFLDTGGGSLPEVLDDDTVGWLQDTAEEKSIAHGGRYLPSLLFMHIPAMQYGDAAPPSSDGPWDARQCPSGSIAEDSVTPTEGDSGIFMAMARARIGWAFVGHDHGNDWCCVQRGRTLCFGRHTGYGGYGSWARGSRVVRLEGIAAGEGVVTGGGIAAGEGGGDSEGAAGEALAGAEAVGQRVLTWVRMEDGLVSSTGSLGTWG